MNLTQKTLVAGGWKLAAVVSKAAAQLLVLAVLARFVLPEEFGVVAIAMVVVAFGTMFSQIGLGPALIQRPEITSTHIRVGFTTSILLAVGMWALTWILAPAGAAFFREPAVVPVLRALGFSFILLSFGLVAKALLERDLEFRRIMYAELGSYVVGHALLGIALAVKGFGVWALVGATLGQNFLESLLYVLFRPHDMRPSLSSREFKDLFSFGGGLALSRLFHLLGNYGDNMVVGRFLGAEALGIYGRAFQIMNVPVTHLGNVIDSVMFPAMARIQTERARLGEVFLRSLGIVNLLLMPVGFVGVVLAPEIVAIVLGPNWDSAIVPLQWLMLAASLKGSVRMCDSLARATGAVYRSAARKAVYATAIIGGTWLGHFFGLDGVAIGVTLAVLTVYLLMLHLGLSLVGRTWVDVLRAITPGLLWAGVFCAVMIPTAHVLRAMDLPAVVVAAVAGGGPILLALAVAAAHPPVIGPAGIWLLRRLLEAAPKNMAIVDTVRRRLANV